MKLFVDMKDLFPFAYENTEKLDTFIYGLIDKINKYQPDKKITKYS